MDNLLERERRGGGEEGEQFFILFNKFASGQVPLTDFGRIL
jgi:hypothetical protein